MHFSRLSKILVVAVILFTLTGFSRNLFSWGLFNFFTDTSYSQEGLTRALSFDPDKDILYLPSLKDKELFVPDTGPASVIRDREGRILGVKRLILY